MKPLTIRSKFVELTSFQYICKLIFTNWYSGHNIIFEKSNYPGYEISLEGSEKVIFSSPFFEHILTRGIDESILQKVKIKKFRIDPKSEIYKIIEELPIIFCPEEKSTVREFNAVELSELDILGMCFFLVARVEEYLNTNLDDLGRHRGRRSTADEHGFLYMPLVDIYTEILINFLNKKINTNFKINTKFITHVSCDVDNPFLFHRSLRGIIKRAGADFLLRRDFQSALFTLISGIIPGSYSGNFDPFARGIDYIIKSNDSLGNKVRFNFIPWLTDSRYDGYDCFHSFEVRSMIKRIHSAGHLIGLHPGYNSFDNLEIMKQSIDIFSSMQGELLNEKFISGRQHYLRWRTGITEEILEKCGVNEDSSLGYADTGGFRCGTSKPHNLYDLKNSQTTQVQELPLIVMETTYFGKSYLNLKNEEILNHMKDMKEWCRKMSGTFSILWHNDGLHTAARRQIYENILKA